ncbi:MAG: patatin-like phospholipase family protein [Gammaproteobacteria bacterium]|nr:patatin-like phospholipase family protein [Gammaproteobacteria bacterium]
MGKKLFALHFIWAACLMCLVALTSFVTHASTELTQTQVRPKVGLVLSGGGARGFAHIGVLKILEENHIPIDYIAGTSMGAIIGGLYASGMSAAEIEVIVNRVDWDQVFFDSIPRQDRSFRRKRDDDFALVKSKPGYSDGKIKLPQGLVQGESIALLLQKLALPVATVKDFDKLSIPFRAVATDIVTGKPVVLGSGNLAQALRASMSIPAAMVPVEIEGKLLVDGGISINLPVAVVREMGADVLIVVDISTPLLTRDELDSTIEITKQLSGLLTQRETLMQLNSLVPEDILVVPELGDITSGDFSRGIEIAGIGAKAASAKITALRSLSLSDDGYAAHVAERPKPSKELPVINFVHLNNQSQLDDEVLNARLTIQTGQPLDIALLEADIGRIYGLELFQAVMWELVEEDGQTGLVLHVKERSWGPDYLQFGLNIEGDLEGNNQFNLSIGYLGTAINKLGGEWRSIAALGEEPSISAELYQPLDVGSHYFFHPSVLVERDNVDLFQGEDKIAELRQKRGGVTLAAGRELGTWGEFRLGWRRFTGESSVRVGDPALAVDDFETGQGFVKLSIDDVDNLYFPRAGIFGDLEWRFSREDLGDDSDYEQGLLTALGVKSWERNTVTGGLRYFTTPDDNASVESLFRAGGFLRLSGLQSNELSGQHYAQLTVNYRRQILDFNLIPTYVGASLEVGNVWNNKADISFDNTINAGSIYLGFDTFVGPLYFAYGRAERGRSSFYVFLGRIFAR